MDKSPILIHHLICTDNHYLQGYHEGDTYSCLAKVVWPNSDQYDLVA